MKPLRDEQRDQTRERLLDGAERALRDGRTLSCAAAAAAADLPLRTAYRYFETRQALDTAVWQRVRNRFSKDIIPTKIDDYHAQTREMFARFSADPALVRGILRLQETGRLPPSDEAPRRDALEQFVCEAAPSLPARERRRVAAVLHVLNSAAAWESLTELCGLDAAEAASSVELAVEALLVGLGRRSESVPPGCVEDV